jgi:hypothetical protein
VSAAHCLDEVEASHDELLLARRSVESAEYALVKAITLAVNHHSSWAAIATAMGIRRQTAWDWYQRHHNPTS